MSTLILRSGAVGDVILTFPLVLACRRLYGEEDVVLAAPGYMQPVARLCGIDRYADIDTCGLHRLLGPAFRPEDAPPLFRAAERIVNLLCGEDARLHARLRRCAPVVWSLSPPRDGIGMHAAIYCTSVLPEEERPCAVEEARLLPDRLGELPPRVSRLLGGAGRPVITIHPGSGSRRKCVDPALFEGIAARLAARARVVILTGPAEEAHASFWADAARRHGCVHARGLTLAEAARLLHRSAGYVGLDSGISHLAGLANTRGYAVFHATDPAVWRPFCSSIVPIPPEEAARLGPADFDM